MVFKIKHLLEAASSFGISIFIVSVIPMPTANLLTLFCHDIIYCMFQPAHWVLPDTKGVAKVCGNMITTRQLVAAQYGELCVSLARAELHYQLDCAALLGVRLQKANVSNNIYNLCHITRYSPSEVILQMPF
ncbi:hypothetical protein Vadar_022743 [Vaccinium darrowii]|uniref:Uncharacterized protein n=1 Tax=Vaccinium darrowii TaxID=229202 RepID=A0ACB7XTK2_9ERIC|nr:hypothetical protein Vadar_022743 [Vaccinium darrowii]